jgi:hypothetical protein
MINHPTFGRIDAPASEDGAIFQPLVWLSCPGNLERLRRYAVRRFMRAGGADGLTGRVRASRCEDAADMLLQVFTDRDYQKAGITEDEVGRAIMGAARYCDRAQWRNGSGRRQGDRRYYPRVSSMSAGGDNPARLAAAIETVAARYPSAIRREIDRANAREALCGAGGEEKTGETYMVDGGSLYPETDGRMVSTSTRTAYVDRPGQTDDGTAYKYAAVPMAGGWKMERRKAHKPETYGGCTVADVADTDDTAPRYAGHAPIPAAVPGGAMVRSLPYDADREYAIARDNLANR